MKERPILFSTPMVQAILEGRKTQTRRVMKKELPIGARWWGIVGNELCFRMIDSFNVQTLCKCPFGEVGDRLWVRETWRGGNDTLESVFYRADITASTPIHEGIQKWKPSIHMPRWASRITLEITNIRVERLQDISEADARAEGFIYRPEVSDDPQVHKDAAIDWYSDLWNNINGANAWQNNPWVWVIEFRRSNHD